MATHKKLIRMAFAISARYWPLSAPPYPAGQDICVHKGWAEAGCGLTEALGRSWTHASAFWRTHFLCELERRCLGGPEQSQMQNVMAARSGLDKVIKKLLQLLLLICIPPLLASISHC